MRLVPCLAPPHASKEKLASLYLPPYLISNRLWALVDFSRQQ
jgi:hypothetical protein